MKRRGDRPAKVRHDTHPVRVVAKAKPPPFDGAKSVTTFECFYDKLAVISGLLGKAFIFFHSVLNKKYISNNINLINDPKIGIVDFRNILKESLTMKKLGKEFIKFEKRLNDKIKKLSDGKTCVSFKYTLIERLKEIGCPEQIIFDVIGLAKKESFYGNDISFDIKSSWLSQLVHI